ncbi:hypothetical protein [Arhodomonas aquaeolei]|uniref:hypothetical protein n=1 Tax=Arhodomonas aquaeolei TaxID=2369 RepID=UPI0003713575|nr:hypothetical protein [Arhodomonas aquaeolei]
MGPSAISSAASATAFETALTRSLWVSAVLTGTYGAGLVPLFLLTDWSWTARAVWFAVLGAGLARGLYHHGVPGRGRVPLALRLPGEDRLDLVAAGGIRRVRLVASHRAGPLLVVHWAAGVRRGCCVLGRDGVADWRGLCRALRAAEAAVSGSRA